MKYYLRDRLETGLGTPEFYERFNTIAERYARYRLIVGAGYRLIEFGIKN
jgi:hypothetical protein